LDTNFWGFFMTKYDERFKLSVVQQYLDGEGGYTALAREHRLAHSLVKRWVQRFRTHGSEAFKKKFSHYSAEFKLLVLRHMWENELSYGQTAVQFDIRNPGALGVWERSFHSGGLEALKPRPRGRSTAMAVPTAKPDTPSDDEKRSREELLAELDYLRMENAYLKKLQALVQARPKQVPPKKRK
jgi:transposase